MIPRLAIIPIAAFPLIDLGLHGHVATSASHLVLLAGLGTVAVTLLTRTTAPSATAPGAAASDTVLPATADA